MSPLKCTSQMLGLKKIDLKINCHTCALLESRFDNPVTFLPHLKDHVVKAFNRDTHCEMCGKTLDTVSEYFHHLPLVHAQALQQRYPCNKCGASFQSETRLKYHTKECEALQNAPDIFCEICGFTTKRKATFWEHRRKHEREMGNLPKMVKCQQCESRFTNDKELDKHFKVDHNGIYPFMCDKCPRGFIFKSRLERHHRTHHDNMANYKCGVCYEKFKTLSYVTKHVTSHWHGAPYRCTTCLEMFRCQATGYIHIKKSHGGEGSLILEVSDELKEYRSKYIIPIPPEPWIENRKQTRPLQTVHL